MQKHFKLLIRTGLVCVAFCIGGVIVAGWVIFGSPEQTLKAPPEAGEYPTKVSRWRISFGDWLKFESETGFQIIASPKRTEPVPKFDNNFQSIAATDTITVPVVLESQRLRFSKNSNELVVDFNLKKNEVQPFALRVMKGQTISVQTVFQYAIEQNNRGLNSGDRIPSDGDVLVKFNCPIDQDCNIKATILVK